MNMQFRQGFFHGAAKFDVMPTVHAGGEPGLNAHFAGAEVARFGGAPDDLFDGEKITFFGEMASAEGTKAALLDAHIGEIDVAIDDVADHVADGVGAQLIGGGQHGE